VNSALVSHRGELSKEFGALATQKSEYDNSKKGKKKGVAERVAKDLGDLLEETKKEKAGKLALEELQAELAKTTEERDGLTNELETLKAEHAEAINKMESELSDLKAQLAEANTEVQKVTTEFEACAANRDKLMEELEALKAEHAEAVGKMESELSDLKAQLAAALAELEALKAGHSEGESAQQEALEQQRKLYEELEQAVNSALVSHRGELSKEFGALATQKSEYDNSKKGKKKGVAERVAKDLGDLLEETKKEKAGKLALEELKQKIKQLQAELAKAKKDLAKAIKESDVLKSERDGMPKEIKSLKAGSDSGAKAEAAALAASLLKNSEKLNVVHTEEIAKLQAELKSLERTQRKMEADLLEANEKLVHEKLDQNQPSSIRSQQILFIMFMMCMLLLFLFGMADTLS